MNKITSFAWIVMFGMAAQAWAATGVADVKGTAAGSSIQGTIHFEDTADGLKISGKLTGLPPGEHAFHIHEFGSCAEMGKAAGSHYNPMNAPHGQVMKDGIRHAHAGDLGNITAMADGTATVDALVKDVQLTGGSYDVAGRAVIVHEKVDDFSQPAGNAGGRIGCGSIILIGAPAAPPAK